MAVSITALYTGILVLIIVAMVLNVTFHRFRYGVMICDGGQNTLRRMVRILGNSVESTVLCTLLMALYERDGGAKMLLHAAASRSSPAGYSSQCLCGFTMGQA